MKYNLSSNQADRVRFDEMCYRAAIATFEAAPEAWASFDNDLASDVVEQNSYTYEQNDFVDDQEEAKARDMAQMRAAWESWKSQ